MWNLMPDSLLLTIFSRLEYIDLVKSGHVCKSWHRVSKDEFLWKRLLQKDFNIEPSIPIAPAKNSWLKEFKRLKYHTPLNETEVLLEHSHQVLHVSFSHNGKMFASSSKDGYIKVWSSDYPAKVIFSKDMKSFSWNYTQFSQFNEADTLLLVSGVHFGNHTASGEIAVFNLQDFKLQCRVLNKPYDIFGTWYANEYLLSGRLHFLANLVSCSILWLNKAWQESESEKRPIIKKLFKFYNRNASSIRNIMVANCLTVEDSNGGGSSQNESSQAVGEGSSRGNPVSRNALSSSQWETAYRYTSDNLKDDVKLRYGAESGEICTTRSPIRYNQDYRCVESGERASSSHYKNDGEEEDNTESDFDDPLSPWDDENSVASKSAGDQEGTDESDDIAESLEEETSGEKILDHREKFLIFTTGSLTYTSHQIGIKRIKPLRFTEQLLDTPTLTQRLNEREERKQQAHPNPDDPELELSIFDKLDYLFDFHGHIIGMGLSPDHRYLYVNSRPWPKNCRIEDPLDPPPIAQEIDIHVIDLVTMKEVGHMLRSHKAYTPNDECFFIFLDVSNQYVASGAEDKHGYLWDRHYGNCLGRIPHTDVVNSVAFNPADPEMLVTASDDNSLKIWRSKNRIRELGLRNS